LTEDKSSVIFTQYAHIKEASNGKETEHTVSIMEADAAEIHNYARHDFGLLVGWFTFFCTSNYVAIGIFASTLAQEGKLKSVFGLIAVALMFAFHCALGIGACYSMKDHFRLLRDRLADHVESARTPTEAISLRRGAAASLTKYNTLINLMLGGLCSFFAVWLALILGVFYFR
jgi:hypothetical protein